MVQKRHIVVNSRRNRIKDRLVDLVIIIIVTLSSLEIDVDKEKDLIVYGALAIYFSLLSSVLSINIKRDPLKSSCTFPLPFYLIGSSDLFSDYFYGLGQI